MLTGSISSTDTSRLVCRSEIGAGGSGILYIGVCSSCDELVIDRSARLPTTPVKDGTENSSTWDFFGNYFWRENAGRTLVTGVAAAVDDEQTH